MNQNLILKKFNEEFFSSKYLISKIIKQRILIYSSFLFFTNLFFNKIRAFLLINEIIEKYNNFSKFTF